MAIETIDLATYERERAICDKAAAYWEANATHGRGGSSMSAEPAAHPDYAACDNDMRGRVEQYEILRDVPAEIFAYIGNYEIGKGYPVQVWTGRPIGYASKGATWRVDSYIGLHMSQFYARIGGREYTGRGFGEGLCIRLRETAASARLPRVPASFPVRPLRPGSAEAEAARDLVTCGNCGRSWDDGVATSYTPAPSGRCPFEAFHKES